MKKIVIILLAMQIIMTNAFAFANKFSEEEVVELVDSKTKQADDYVVVNLMLGGDDILADVPAIIYELDGKGRTLVPINSIAEKIGAEISWDGEKQEVSLNYNGKEIVLKIDSSVARVNGKEYDLPNKVPAKLLTYKGISRTMVPVNFITQHLGYEIFWLSETRTVSINKPQQTLSAVRYVDGEFYPELRFKVSGEVSMTSFSVDGKLVGKEDKLIIDLHNTKLDLTNPPKYGRYIINDMIQEIFDVQLTQTGANPYNTQAVVSLGSYRNGDVSFDESTGEMVVQLINSVSYVEMSEVAGIKSLIIDTTEGPAVNSYAEDGKYYVDIMHSKLEHDEFGQIDVGDGEINTIKYTQMENDEMYENGTKFTRVEIDVESKSMLESIYVDVDGSKVIVYITGIPYGRHQYAKDVKSGSSTFEVELETAATYPITFDESLKMLSFSIPKENATLEALSELYDDGVVEGVVISSDKSGDNYEIQIYLEKGTTYKTNASSTSMSITFENVALKNSKYKEKLIVIDAGHGGYDPGALSINGTKEKDVVLKASHILKKKLENKGFKVYMTRERDNYVKLYDRAGIANQLDADLFISIHINAAVNTKAYGMETLYAPDTSRNNKEFARAVQDNMLELTNAKDRGIVSRPELAVIRATEMDAILVELGFVSNLHEEMLLLSEDYLNKCTEGIVNGIIEFME